MKAPSETSLVKACLELLRLYGVMAWRNNTTGVFDPARKRFRTFTGLKGVSDILGIIPPGRFLAVECKMPGGKPTIEQAWFLEEVERRGGVSVLARSTDDVESKMEELGIRKGFYAVKVSGVEYGR